MSTSLEAKVHKYAMTLPKQMVGQADLQAQFPNTALDDIGKAINNLSKKNLIKTMDLGKQGIKWQAVSKGEAKKLASLDDEEGLVYRVIEQAGRDAIWTMHIRTQTNLHQTVVNKVLKALEGRNEIKVVKSIKFPTRKLYMLFHLTPSVEMTGGPWFTDHELDTEFIKQLLSAVLSFIKQRSFPKVKNHPTAVFPPSHTSSYPSASQIATWIRKAQISTTELDVGHVRVLLDVLEFDGEIQALPASGGSGGGEWRGKISGGQSGASSSKKSSRSRTTDGSDSDVSDSDDEARRARRRKKAKLREMEKEKRRRAERKKRKERERRKRKKAGSSDDDSGSGSDSDGSASGSGTSDDDRRSSKSKSKSKKSSSKSSRSSSKSRSKRRGSSDSGTSSSDSDSDPSDALDHDTDASSASSLSDRSARKAKKAKKAARDKKARSRSRSKSRGADDSDVSMASDADSDDEAAARRKAKKAKAKRVEIALESSDDDGDKASKRGRKRKGKESSSEPEERPDLADVEDDEGDALVYRAVRPEKVDLGYTAAPCGRCPVFELCAGSGPISPDDCSYYGEWLDQNFG